MLTSIKSALYRAHIRARDQAAARRTVRLLDAQPDYLLRDMGLTRSSLKDAVLRGTGR